MVKMGLNEKKLLNAAIKGVKNAYVIGSCKVGAAVFGEDGRIYEGCNVESRVSGLGVCAERNAIDHAVLHGNRKIKEVAVVVPADTQNAPTPCGACLQYIHDFASDPRVRIIIAKVDKGKTLLETVDVKTIGELLPFPYKKMNSNRSQA